MNIHQWEKSVCLACGQQAPEKTMRPTAIKLALSQSPLGRMDTRGGMQEVKTMLVHVEHGMPV